MSDHTTVRRPMLHQPTDYLFVLVLGVAVTIFGGVWLVGQLAGVLFAGVWPHVTLDDTATILGQLPQHLDDPRRAWPAPAQPDLPGPGGFAAATVLTFVLTTTGLASMWRLLTDRRQRHGFASPHQTRTTFGHAAALRQAPRLRPGLAKPAITDVAVTLGTAAWRKLWLPIETSVLLLAAPRQGKTSQVIIPWLRSWPGAALVTSVRRDVVLATMSIRKARGPVAVMDLSCTPWPCPLRWSPTTDCEHFDKARQRADVMVQVGKTDGPSDSTNAGYFGLTATNLLAAWLHAAALTSRSMDDVLRWALAESNDEPIHLLASAPGAAPGVAQMLDAIYRSPAETRSNMWTTVLTAVAPLLSDAARAVFCPEPGDGINLDNFLTRSGTLYLLVDEKQASDLAPLISAFVDELVIAARRHADATPAGRIDPPLALILDEVANVAPLPSLPALMSYAAGSGIFVVAVLQSIAQARARWGRDGADMLWAAATTKIALGGLAGDELGDLSTLAGEYRETVHSWTYSEHHGTTAQATLNDRKTMAPDRIRTLSTERWQALIVHATTPAVLVRMTRHYRSAHASEYERSVTETLAELARHSQPQLRGGSHG
jgi:type IV secretory pathway TraG/TraD family ATPase VirD4